jgi:uncharacterized protein YqgC (DUF456 family)
MYCYLFCFLLIVTVDLLGSSDMSGERMYLLLMPLLALSLFLFSDFTAHGISRRIKGYRWSIMSVLIGLITSLFVESITRAGILILATSLAAPFLRVRKITDRR